MENNRKILITGAKGFVGRNLICELRNRGYENLFEYDLDTPAEELARYTRECDFVYHLAGVNRPKDEKEFKEGNFGFTDTLLNLLKSAGNKAPVLISSSIQAELDNAYGISKREAEDLLFSYGEENGVTVFVYRFPNVFGKWCRPNYNSVVATFCHNIAHDLEIQINDPSRVMNLVYIDDVMCEMINAMEGKANLVGRYAQVPTTHTILLGALAERIQSFKEMRRNFGVPDFSDELTRKLYSTYLSYLPEDDFAYPLEMKCDQRGSFTEFIRTSDRGQVSVNVAKPGITKGNHWHHTKNEKFLVVKGKAEINFRKVGDDKIITYKVDDSKLMVVDIPTGYTHNIVNVGEEDLVTVMWANEAFNPDKPDTYFEKV